MPNIQVRLRRGSATDHDTTSGGFTGAEGEVTVDTTNDTLRVHDGSTPGGIRLAKHDDLVSGAVPDNAVSTAKIVDDAVTFAKMQNINTAKVIGRTTAGSGDPEEVTILDEDTMTSDSATALATQQSIKAYVDSQVLSKWDSGWVDQDDQTTPVSVGDGATMVLDHDLGSAALGAVFSVYVAEDSSGTNMQAQEFIFSLNAANENKPRGIQVTSITSTQVTVQLAEAGYAVNSSGDLASGGGTIVWGTGTNQYSHIRVVLVG